MFQGGIHNTTNKEMGDKNKSSITVHNFYLIFLYSLPHLYFTNTFLIRNVEFALAKGFNSGGKSAPKKL